MAFDLIAAYQEVSAVLDHQIQMMTDGLKREMEESPAVANYITEEEVNNLRYLMEGYGKGAVEYFYSEGVQEALRPDDVDRELGITELPQDLRDLIIIWTILRMVAMLTLDSEDIMLNNIDEMRRLGEQPPAGDPWDILALGVGSAVEFLSQKIASIAKAFIDDYMNRRV